MKKKITALILALACALCCAFALTACGGETPKVNGLLIAKTGESPNPGSVASVTTTVTYGQTPDLNFYKLYLSYTNGDTKELDRNDPKLTVKYYRYASGSDNEIDELPTEYLAGLYTVQYVYDGNEDYKAKAYINVSRAVSGAFSVLPAKTLWYDDENMPSVTLRNPQGLTVERDEDGSVAAKNDDTNGLFYFYHIKKSAYDDLTAEQRTDYEFIRDYVSDHRDDAGSFDPRYEYDLPVGEYMIFAEVYSTHNYEKLITPAVEVTVKSAIVERTFTLQSIVLQDYNHDPVTDPDNEMVEMTENFDTNNRGNTVVCKANGEVRGTVDFGAGPFDELAEDEVYTYYLNGTDEIVILKIEDGVETYAGQGKKVGNTLTVELVVQAESTYYWIVTFTCQ